MDIIGNITALLEPITKVIGDLGITLPTFDFDFGTIIADITDLINNITNLF